MERYVERTFRHVAEAKTLDFFIRMDSRLPAAMLVDAKRLQQVLKNLLSNAFKFTHRGHVTLTVEPVKTGWDPENENLNRAGDVIAFSVMDTGIGISSEKQQIIFEAFQQADGSTSRKYGGTGLGLAISRELARVLGGELRLVSAPRVGSTFTLYLPQIYTPPRFARKSAPATLPRIAAAPAAPVAPTNGETVEAFEARTPDEEPRELVAGDGGPINEVGDDRENLTLGAPVLLIVENDLAFARFVLEAAREKGFRGIVTSLGASALALAAEYKPSAISLDIFLPDIDGWRVIDRLKHDAQTRHIPVAVVSTDDARERALNAGAFAFLSKPIQSKEMLDGLLGHVMRFIQRTPKNLLAVTADAARRDWLKSYLAADDVQVTVSPGYEAAVAMIEGQAVDCLVVDASLPPPDGEALTAPANGKGNSNGQANGVEPLPVVLFGSAADPGRLSGWQRLAKHRVVREARSPEDLLDQASFFLHRTPAGMPEAHRKILRELRDANEVLHGKKALIVDDDMRNIFALTSLLEDRGMIVSSHDNGRDAVKALHQTPDVDVILMDIMMPEMDGIDTIREIRKIPACKHVPIIAVTAKAMKGDREKCMEAGAWDYLSKPVDTDLMVGVLRAWLG
jgi:CheY-like chemotaxis protein